MENTSDSKKGILTGMSKHINLGLLAHVDAGKTTLSEALLYLSGNIRKIGRVDKKDAFLDTYEMEKARGITIFSKQAELTYENMELTLLDTPGACGFFDGNGADAAGFGLRGPCNQRCRWMSGTYGDALEAFEPVSGAGCYLYQQNGSAGNRQRNPVAADQEPAQ